MAPMKLYTQPGIPNPDVVHMYIAEVGCHKLVENVICSVNKMENRSPEFLKINPLGEIPALITQENVALCESTTIVKYLDELHGPTSVVGQNSLDRGLTDMWIRRVDEKIIAPMGEAFRSGTMAKWFAERRPGYIHPEVVEPMRKASLAGLKWLDTQLSDGRQFLCGDRFTLADIRFYTLVSFFLKADKPANIPAELVNVTKYLERLSRRPSAEAIAKKPKPPQAKL
eukprot:TRINITY_DN101352_c0_g1_i1.p1 TRINITY_DN101352_c0_g1~~TRINITY_DN101352_c0_g1_i1.p1  ORF type:complete len:248 (-),score=25.11 TRINITY_DN101352_c0_g1_i1:71-751(-)